MTASGRIHTCVEATLLTSNYPPWTCLVQVNNLYLSDFPTHDMAADFVLLAEQWQTAEGTLKEQYKVRPPAGGQRGPETGGWGALIAEQGSARSVPAVNLPLELPACSNPHVVRIYAQVRNTDLEAQASQLEQDNARWGCQTNVAT